MRLESIPIMNAHAFVALFAIAEVVGFGTMFAAAPALFAQDPINTNLFTPLMQLGFAGAFLTAIWLLVMLFRAYVGLIATRREDWTHWMESLMTLQKTTNQIVSDNSVAYRGVCDSQEKLCSQLADLGTHTERLYEAMLRRPCLAQEQRT